MPAVLELRTNWSSLNNLSATRLPVNQKDIMLMMKCKPVSNFHPKSGSNVHERKVVNPSMCKHRVGLRLIELHFYAAKLLPYGRRWPPARPAMECEWPLYAARQLHFYAKYHYQLHGPPARFRASKRYAW